MTGKRIKTLVWTAVVILLLAASSAFALGDVSVEVADRTGFAQATLDDGAIVQYIGDLNTTYGASGSGVFNPFVRLQGNEKKTTDEKGYNTDGTREFDTKAGTWTHSIKLSEIPTILVSGNVYWEFWADINDSDSTPLISLDDFELYLTTNPSLTGYPFTGIATRIYDYTAANNGYYILINDVNQGSGRGDLRYLVPVSDTGVDNCNYGNPACTTYLVLYSVWGGKGDPYGFDGGFEEWKVKKYPILQVSKDISGAFDTPVSWKITKDFDATYDLFAGGSVTHGYKVSVDPILGDPENTMVSGTITILGDEKDPVNATITDFFNGAPATITGCSVPQNGDSTYTIAAKATVTCSYELALGDVAPVDGTNLARASYDMDSVSLAFQGSVEILAGDYVEAFTGYPEITVDDDNLVGEDWSASYISSETWEYTRDFACPTDTSLYKDGVLVLKDHVNTAKINETGQSDIATVKVTCYAPVVKKTAETYWNRDWDWTIVKDYDGDYDLFAGESKTHGYKVSVDPTYTDNFWGVKGDIYVYNNHPTDDMTLTSVSDLAGGTAAAVDCPLVEGKFVVPAAGSLTCTYDTGAQDSPDVNPFGGTNTATAVFAGVDWTGTAAIVFSATPTTEDEPVITVDDDNLTGEEWSANRAYAEWEYTRDFACPTDTSKYTGGVLVLEDHVNTATIIETGQFDTATVKVTCYAPVVEKTAETYWNRDWDWTIVKVDDGDYDLFAGESKTHGYKVSVDPTYTDNFWGVKGSITVYNDHPTAPMTLADLTDDAGGTAAAVDCPLVEGKIVVPAAGSLTCTYDTGAQNSPDDNPFGPTNTATAVFAGADWTGTADIVFSTDPTTEDDPEITIDDDNLTGEEWTANRAYAEWEYTRDFACPTDTSKYTGGVLVLEDHINTATIIETKQFDTATVKVTCYALLVSKDAQPSFTRTYHWTVLKEVDNPGPITLPRGGSVVVNYTITVDLAPVPYTDSDWAVKGTITIANPAPMAASLSSVTDTISPDIAAAVVCPAGLTVPAGGSLECTYSADLPDAAFRTNTATATLAEIGTSFSGSAGVDFAEAAINEVDEMVYVDDSYFGPLGTCAAGDAPCEFTYPRTITADDAFCGSFTVDNTATITTNDNGYTDSDDASVVIEVPCEGCTPGFWQGGAGVQLWDQWPDPQWTYVGLQPFYTQKLFNDYFNVMTDPRLAGLTMLDLVGTGGTSDSARRAARDMVAAYLNESAFPGTFPAESLAWLETEWYAAVAGGDAALDAFHVMVSGWNDPPEPGFCPLP